MLETVRGAVRRLLKKSRNAPSMRSLLLFFFRRCVKISVLNCMTHMLAPLQQFGGVLHPEVACVTCSGQNHLDSALPRVTHALYNKIGREITSFRTFPERRGATCVRGEEVTTAQPRAPSDVCVPLRSTAADPV